MNTKTYNTKTDAVQHNILPTLGDMGNDYDIDGIFDKAFDYDQKLQAFVRNVDEDGFWEIAVGHMLGVFIDWRFHDNGTRYAEWSVESRLGTPLATGRIDVTLDNDTSFDIVEAEVTKHGFEMGDTQNIEPDWAEFCIQRIQ